MEWRWEVCDGPGYVSRLDLNFELGMPPAVKDVHPDDFNLSTFSKTEALTPRAPCIYLALF